MHVGFELAMQSWVTARLVALRSLWTIALGGAAGGVLDYIQAGLAAKTFSFSRIDYHQIAMTAAGTAAVALFFHWKPRPTDGLPFPTSPATVAPTVK